MNLAALTTLGLETLSPNVHPLSGSLPIYIDTDTAHWEVTGLRVNIGARTLAVDSAVVFKAFPYGTNQTTPLLLFGTASFIDRTIVVSYSSQHFCVGQP
jgi:hypothetical protein